MSREVCSKHHQGQTIRSISDQGHNYRSIETSSGNTLVGPKLLRDYNQQFVLSPVPSDESLAFGTWFKFLHLSE